MVAVAKRREIKKTEFIIKEDEDGKEIFVLEHGRIEVSYYDEDGTRKKLKEIDAPGADEFSFALLSKLIFELNNYRTG
jgi:CRP-like cAMP-binding protein